MSEVLTPTADAVAISTAVRSGDVSASAVVEAAIEGGKYDARSQLQILSEAADSAPKSRRWKMRARVGERMRWYEVPEETPHE